MKYGERLNKFNSTAIGVDVKRKPPGNGLVLNQMPQEVFICMDEFTDTNVYGLDVKFICCECTDLVVPWNCPMEKSVIKTL